MLQHLVAGRRLAVPRAAHGDEGVAAVILREGVAGVERELHRRGVRRVEADRVRRLRAPLVHRDAARRVVLRVRLAVGIDVGPAVLAALDDVIELLVLLVVAEPVDAMVHAVEFAAPRLEAVADRVAQAGRVDGAGRAVGLGAHHGGVLGVGLAAGVAGGADGDVELAVRPHLDHPVGVLPARGQIGDDALERLQRAVGAPFGAVDLGHRRQPHVVADDLDAVHHRPRGDDLALGLALVDAAVAVGVAQHHHVADRAARDVERPVIGHRDHARVDEVLGEQLDLEAVRQLQLGDPIRRRLDLLRLQDVADDRDVGGLGIRQLLAGRPDRLLQILSLLRPRLTGGQREKGGGKAKGMNGTHEGSSGDGLNG